MITVKTISNIYKKNWIKFFRSNNIKNYSTAIGNFEILKAFLEVVIAERPELIEKIDEFIFEELAYLQPNLYYLKNINLPNNFSLNESDIIESKFDFLNLKRSFFDDAAGGAPRIFSSRYYSNSHGEIESIDFVIKVTETKESPAKNFFCSVTLDFVNHFLSIGYSKNKEERYADKPSTEWKPLLEDFIKKDIFPLFNISMGIMNEIKLKKALYYLYEELSKEIENKLEQALPKDINSSVTDFLKKVGITPSNKYIRQLYSIVFQEYGKVDSKEFQSGLYDKGWVFRFVFKEGKCTRAASRQEDFTPIYTSPIYWNLKELITNAGELEDAGFVWILIINKRKIPIQVRLDVLNNSVYYYFYKQKEPYRREKSNYVRGKIRYTLRRLYPKGIN